MFYSSLPVYNGMTIQTILRLRRIWLVTLSLIMPKCQTVVRSLCYIIYNFKNISIESLHLTLIILCKHLTSTIIRSSKSYSEHPLLYCRNPFCNKERISLLTMNTRKWIPRFLGIHGMEQQYSSLVLYQIINCMSNISVRGKITINSLYNF